jgi:putative ABC transport system permease protein
MQVERGRELAVLRANGLTPRQLWALVMGETGLIGLLSGLLAVPLGLLQALVLIHVINRRSFGWTLQTAIDPLLLLQAVGLAILAALLAGIYPAWRMARTSPALALREE